MRTFLSGYSKFYQEVNFLEHFLNNSIKFCLYLPFLAQSFLFPKYRIGIYRWTKGSLNYLNGKLSPIKKAVKVRIKSDSSSFPCVEESLHTCGCLLTSHKCNCIVNHQQRLPLAPCWCCSQMCGCHTGKHIDVHAVCRPLTRSALLFIATGH